MQVPIYTFQKSHVCTKQNYSTSPRPAIRSHRTTLPRSPGAVLRHTAARWATCAYTWPIMNQLQCNQVDTQSACATHIEKS